MPQRNVATNFTFEQQRVEINELAADFWTQKGVTDTALPTFLKHDGSNDFTGQTLAVPNAFTINSNSGNGTVTISGNLDVTGTTTTGSSANLEVTDKNILIAKGSTSDSQADGAGITIDSATDITFNFVDAKDALVSSIGLESTTTLAAGGLATLQGARFAGTQTPTAGVGVEITQPDANTGNIQTYDRTNSAYKDLRIKGTGIDFYAGSTNAIVGGFHNTGLVMQAGKTITGVLATAAQPNITSLGTLTGLTVDAGANGTIDFGDTDSGTVAFGRLYADNTGTFIGSKSNHDLILRTNNVETTRIDVDGKLVHKCNKASGYIAEFHQEHADNPGTILIDGPSDGNIRPTAIELAQAGSVKWGIGQVYASTASQAFHICSGAATEANAKLTIRTDGNVGIGTNNPGAALTVTGGGGAGAFIYSAGATNGGVLDLRNTQTSNYTWRLAVGGGDNAYVHGRGFFIRDENSSATRFVIDENGNVGMGVTQPDCELHVKGAGTVARFEGTGGNAFIDLYDSDDSTRCFVGCDGGTFKIQTSGNSWSDKLTVSPAGDLAVSAGTISDVAGNVRFLPRNEPGSAYTAVVGDAGKFISTSSDVTFNGGIWSTGHAITVYNYGGSPINIVSGGSSFLMHWTDGTTAATGTRVLASRGVCTLLCVQGPNTFVISGALT